MSKREQFNWRAVLRQRRTLLVIVALLLMVLIGGTVYSIAAFTDSSQSTSKITAGDLTFTLSPATAIVDTTALRPGVTKTGQVQLTNNKAAATFLLGFTGIGSAPLAGVLQLTVAEVSPVSNKQLYTGALSAVPPIPLGRLASAESMKLSFTFAWPAANQDPTLQGQSVPLVLQWSATT